MNALLEDMAAKGVDVDLTLSILADHNSGFYDSALPVKATGVPAIDGHTVVSLAGRSDACLLYTSDAADE